LEAAGVTAAEGQQIADEIAATEEAAGAGLPFHDAALEGRVTQTLDDIDAGVTRYSQDDTVFQNRGGLLPKEGPGYYSEYTVDYQAVSGRGAERLVVGANGEVYYTPDHYGSLRQDPVTRWTRRTSRSCSRSCRHLVSRSSRGCATRSWLVSRPCCRSRSHRISVRC
jgi:guanyl-specific ribonuclease Sa